MTVLIQPPGLLDLPDDLLRIALSRRYLPPTTLVAFACASKAAAQVALPELYTTLLIPSIASLPLIYVTLCSRPDLARHVRSVTASRLFALSYQFLPLEKAIHECRMCPGSPIVSVSKAIKRCGLNTLNAKLPMPWLVRIARICPQLTAVNMSDLDDLGIAAKYLFFGLADLATILRARRGRFLCRSWPFSCILVKDRRVTPFDLSTGSAAFVPDVYFVDAVDWGRKHIDVTDYLGGDPTLGTDFCLMPFRDLVPLHDQENWRIGDAELQNYATKYDLHRNGRWVVTGWLQSKRKLWLMGGLAHGQDRVFDFSQQPPLVKGNVTLGLPMIDLMNEVSRSLRAQTEHQCTHLLFDGVDPSDRFNYPIEEQEQVVATTMYIFSALADRPLPFVTSLRFTSAFFIDETTVSHMMHILAQGAPNLVHLTLLNAVCPIDYILNHADALIRRSLYTGKLLQELFVSSFVPDPTINCCQHVSSPKEWPLAATHQLRSPLGKGHPASKLTVLELALTGAGVDYLDSKSAARVTIHPDILRHVRSLRLESVQLYLPPPHLAQPDSPSFIPLAHVPPRAVPLNHMLTLANLERLTVSSNALTFSTTHRSGQPPVAHALPHTPSLTELFLSIDPVHKASQRFTTALIAPLLRHRRRFPRLAYARFAYLTCRGESKEQRARAIQDEFFAPYPRDLAPCPCLRAVVVNEEEPIEYYWWLRKREGWGEELSEDEEAMGMSPLAVE